MCARGLGCARPAAAPAAPCLQGGLRPGPGPGQPRVPITAAAAAAGQRRGLLCSLLGRPRPRGGSAVVRRWLRRRRWRLLLPKSGAPRRAQRQPHGRGDRGPGGGRGGSRAAGLQGSDSSSPGAAAAAATTTTAAAARRAGS